MDDWYQVWADGSSAGTADLRPGGWAAIVVRPDGLEQECSGGVTLASNNSMELTAIYYGLYAVPHGSSVRVYTDSESAVKWMTGLFRRKHPRVVELCSQIEAVVQAHRLTVEYRHVRGHSGLPLNERAHDLASAARLAVGQ